MPLEGAWSIDVEIELKFSFGIDLRVVKWQYDSYPLKLEKERPNDLGMKNRIQFENISLRA